MPDKTWQGAEELRGGNDYFSVFRPHRAGRQSCKGELVRLLVSEAHGEGAYRLFHHRRHEGSQPARVKSTGEEKPERHVTHEMASDCSFKLGAYLNGALPEIAGRVIRP